VEVLSNEPWCFELAYLAEIFHEPNFLNSDMQARNENILTSTDKINTSEEIDKLIKTCTCRERRIFPIVIERNYPLIFVSL